MTPARSHLIPSDRGGYEAVVRDACHVRRFEQEPVPRADVEHMVALASCAASPCNSQAWRLIAVQDPNSSRTCGARSWVASRNSRCAPNWH